MAEVASSYLSPNPLPRRDSDQDLKCGYREMRWSELVGLHRGKVDLENRKIQVTEQLVQLGDRASSRTEPKTAAGMRSITIAAGAHPKAFQSRMDRSFHEATQRRSRVVVKGDFGAG